MNSKNHCIAFWKAPHRFLSQNSRPIAGSTSIMLVQDCHKSPQHPLMPSANRQPKLRGSNELCSVARSNHIEVTFCLQKWMKTIFPEMMCDICDFVLGSNISNSRDAVVYKLYKLQEKYVKKEAIQLRFSDILSWHLVYRNWKIFLSAQQVGVDNVDAIMSAVACPVQIWQEAWKAKKMQTDHRCGDGSEDNPWGQAPEASNGNTAHRGKQTNLSSYCASSQNGL